MNLLERTFPRAIPKATDGVTMVRTVAYLDYPSNAQPVESLRGCPYGQHVLKVDRYLRMKGGWVSAREIEHQFGWQQNQRRRLLEHASKNGVMQYRAETGIGAYMYAAAGTPEPLTVDEAVYSILLKHGPCTMKCVETLVNEGCYRGSGMSFFRVRRALLELEFSGKAVRERSHKWVVL